MKVAYDVTNHLGMESNEDKADLQTHYQSTLQSCFNLGFEVICPDLACWLHIAWKCPLLAVCP